MEMFNPAEYKVVVIGQNCFGCADTLEEAKQNCVDVGISMPDDKFFGWVAHIDTTVHEVTGQLQYPRRFPPFRLGEV
jgi:hypothetical protein